MFVPLTWEGENQFHYKFVCPGNAESFTAVYERLFVRKTIDIVLNLDPDELCGKTHAYIAYNNLAKQFEVSDLTGEMLKYNFTHETGGSKISWEWEIQEAFFESNNIKPHWYNCNFTWGRLNHSTGKWNGGVGMIQRDEVDYAIFDYAGTYGRSKIASIAPGQDHKTHHWLTRYPKQLSPTWNLLGLLTKVIFSNHVDRQA